MSESDIVIANYVEIRSNIRMYRKYLGKSADTMKAVAPSRLLHDLLKTALAKQAKFERTWPKETLYARLKDNR